MGVDERSIGLAGAPVFYREAPSGEVPALYLHSVPTSSDDWTELLKMTGGLAPDLPGFGRSGKAGNLDYSLSGYADFVERFLGAVDVDRITLVGHGWGAAIGLVFAQRSPERVQRLTIIDGIPLLDGFSWPPLPRWLRRPGIGELLMGSVSRRLLARELRRGSFTSAAWTNAMIDAVWEQFDQGTQRAILRLYRSVDERALARAGAALNELHQPALVVWGEQDPWLDPAFADAYGRRLANAQVLRVSGAGHWPWLDQPECKARLSRFVAQPADS